MIYRLGDRQPQFDGDDHFVAPDATLIGDVRLAAGASVWFGAVLRGDNDRIDIGPDSNIQDGAILHTDPGIPLTVGARVTVGHRVTLHGCSIGDGSLVGIGSTVLNGASVGRRCLVGAHAQITEGKSFPDGVLIIGAPARVARDLTDAELAALAESADVYTANSRRFREQLASVLTQ
ncbi:MAG: gamma carbonic anhydrase family protein [Woeseiaceae bacterium]|nr:gamma carbonic anhydrase family protein [Woeseiaceae bacterium]